MWVSFSCFVVLLVLQYHEIVTINVVLIDNTLTSPKHTIFIIMHDLVWHSIIGQNTPMTDFINFMDRLALNQNIECCGGGKKRGYIHFFFPTFILIFLSSFFSLLARADALLIPLNTAGQGTETVGLGKTDISIVPLHLSAILKTWYSRTRVLCLRLLSCLLFIFCLHKSLPF